MLRILSGALIATVVLFLGFAAPATAATLGLTVKPLFGFSQTGGIEVTDDGADLQILNAAPLTGFGFPGAGDFDLFVTGGSLDVASPFVDLFIDGASGSIVGELVDFYVSATFAELLFDIVADDFSLFGPQVLMVLTGDFSNGFNADDASVTINSVAVIPLPATLPLLIAAFAAVAAMRRRRV